MNTDEVYIPLSRAELERLVVSRLQPTHGRDAERFARLVRAWYHHKFHDALEAQKADFRAVASPQPDQAATQRFLDNLEAAATAANFRPITEDQLTEALAEESMFRIRLEVAFADFEDVVFFGRGKEQREETIATWFGLRKKDVSFSSYQTVLVYIRFRDDEHIAPELRGTVVLKLFANVPQADLEMLFPNSEVRMRLTDKLFIGIPAFVSGLIVLFTKLGSALLLTGGLLAFWVGLSDDEVQLDQAALVGLLTAGGALGGYLWKQFSNFKNRKIRFMKALTERLYFKNLDNNQGVLTALNDYAEESECKEVLLAYAVLLEHGPLSAADVKAEAERWLAPLTPSFDVTDAINKLSHLSLVTEQGTQLTAVPLTQAVSEMNARWDALFDPED